MLRRRYVLTPAEAKVLTAVDDNEATLPDLAVATRLTPSELRGVVSQLSAKQLLVEVVERPGFINLTEQGDNARRLLEQGERRQVLVLGDEGLASPMDAAKIDRDLDAEMAKLTG